MKRSPRGVAAVVVLAVLAAAAGVTWLIKPSMFPGGSKRAAQSTQATAAVEAATNAQASAAAASVAKIGEANADAPASPSRDFIAAEVPYALTLMPKPDPAKLIEAAAAEHGRTVQLAGAALLALVFLAGWIYTKIYSVSPATLGQIAADVRAGIKPLQSLNTHLAPRLHARVRRAAKLAAEPKDE